MDEPGNGFTSTILQGMCSALEKAHDVPVSTGLCFYGVDLTSIAAEFITDIANSVSRVPVPTIHGGVVPGWVEHDMDVVLASNSGDCEDVLSAYASLSSTGARIHCLTSGGSLARMCLEDGNNLITIPAGLDDAGVFGYSIGALAGLTTDLGIVDARTELRGGIDRFDVSSIDEDVARRVADTLRGNVSAVYSTSDIRACPMWWRYRMYEFGPSFWSELPEFDHNELVGWSDSNSHAPDLRIIVLKGSASLGLVSRIVGSMVQVLETNGRAVEVVDLGNGDVICRNLRGFMYAELVHGIMEARE